MLIIVIVALMYILSYFLIRASLIKINKKNNPTWNDDSNSDFLKDVFWIPVLNIFVSICFYFSYVFEERGIDADVFFRIKDK